MRMIMPKKRLSSGMNQFYYQKAIFALQVFEHLPDRAAHRDALDEPSTVQPCLWPHAYPALAQSRPETGGYPAPSGRGSPLRSMPLTRRPEASCTALDTPRHRSHGLDRDVGTPPAGE